VRRPGVQGQGKTRDNRHRRPCKSERDIELVDLLPAFLGTASRTLHVHEVDMHPNAEGHRIIAAALKEVLTEGGGESGAR